MDFFSGIGGFRKGFELCGMRCVGHCEIDKHADRSYRAIFDVKEDEWYQHDITQVKPGELPWANLWAGGFPCQDISTAGRGGGLDGARSGLFFEIIRLLEGTAPQDRPEWIVLENVRNLLAVNSGFDLAAVLYPLAALGYCVEYGLLNSKWFGVPQHRERIYIVAYRHLGAGGGRTVFPITAGRGKALVQLIGGHQGRRVYSPTGVSCTLMSSSGGQGGRNGLYTMPCPVFPSFVDMSAGNPKLTETARCLKARYNSGISNRDAENSGILLGCAAVLTPDRKKRQNGRRFKDCGEPAFTVTALDRHGVMLQECQDCAYCFPVREATKKGYVEAHCGDSINLAFPESQTRRGRVGKGIAKTLDTSCNQGTAWHGRIRRLTPRECWRLQGFWDELFDKAQAVNSDNQLYRQAGNSVTIPVVYAVGQRIMALEQEQRNVHQTSERSST